MTIIINIWDDYPEDDLGKFLTDVQETFAYVEYCDDECVCDLANEKTILDEFQAMIANLPEMRGVEHEVVFYDSHVRYPTLEEQFHFQRWQINFKNLTHAKREALVEQCQRDDSPFKVISES